MSTSLHGWQLKSISLSLLACLLAWRVPTGSRGPQRAPKRDPKMTQNRSEIHPGGPWHAGCPRGASEALNMHFYAYLCIFCAYLRIFMHVFISFMHIYAYCCTRHPYLCIFMHIYAYSSILMSVHAYLMHVCTHLCSLLISVHIYTYLFTRRR